MKKFAAAFAMSSAFLIVGCVTPDNQSKTDSIDESPVTYEFYRNVTAKLTYNGQVLLLDPMLAEKGSLPSFAGIAPNPTVELPVPAEEIVTGFDTMIISHMHLDHIDPAAAALLPADTPIYTPMNEAPINPADPENTTETYVKQLNDMGFNNVTTIGSSTRDSVTFDGITLTQVYALHGEGFIGTLMGGVNGIILEADDQPTIYWTSDTVLDEAGEVAAIISEYAPDIIIAHPGGAVVEAVAPNPILMDEPQMVKFIELAEEANSNVQIVAVHMNALDHCMTTRESLGKAIDKHPDSDQFKVYLPVEGDFITF